MKPQQPVGREVDAGANSLPVRPGEIRSREITPLLLCIPTWTGYRRLLAFRETQAIRVFTQEECTVPSEFVRGLKCRLCGKLYPKQPLNFCTDDFGPLEVDYDYDAIAEVINRAEQALHDAIAQGAGSVVALPAAQAAAAVA